MSVVSRKSSRAGTLLFEAMLQEDYRKVRFEIISDRNYEISSLTDISPFDPDRTPGADRYPNDINIWFPVVDIKMEALMYARAFISNVEYCQINSYFNLDTTPVQNGEAIFESSRLSNWENGLFVPSKSASVERFSIIKEFYAAPTINRRVLCEFEPLVDDWAGVILVQYQNLAGNWIDFGFTQLNRERDTQFTDKGVDNEIESLNLCLEYIINSYNVSEANPYRDGLYLFYDADADTYRNGQWPWSWGAAIRLLLDCAELKSNPEIGEEIRYSAAQLIDVAYRIGITTLRFQIFNTSHTANHFGTTRYTPRNFSNIGYEELVNTGADTGFLCGWGWSKLYEVTGDQRFLDAATTYIEAMAPILDEFVLPPQEWLPEPNNWTDFTIDESGFGTEGIEALYRMTSNDRYRELCLEYMDKHLAIFEREDGLWDRQYTFSTGEITPTVYMTRGLGWAMEGLLATHRCDPSDGKYLEKAIKMAEVLIEHQLEDGSWGYRFNEPVEIYGAADKGTSLWSLLLFMLHEETGDERHLEAARRALRWCMANQYVGSNPHAHGGIISISAESGITYRSYFRMCCQYTSAFMGLSILKNLKITR
jgi:Highly conserved protein containing a thioredoxin domain